MTKTEFLAIAHVLDAERTLWGDRENKILAIRSIDNVTMSLADVFAQNNSRFDRKLFYKEAGLTS